MSQQSNLHNISLQYQARTSRHGYRETERPLSLLGELQNAASKAICIHSDVIAAVVSGIGGFPVMLSCLW